MTKAIYRKLLIAYHGREDTPLLHARLRAAGDVSKTYIPDSELDQLETFARRVRGEIFFANRWLLVEGQSEYHLAHGVAHGLGYDLDEHGVAVIDFMNNGNPDSFPVLARALGYPWIIVVDGDDAGKGYLNMITKRGFSIQEMVKRSSNLAAGFLEQRLVADGLQPELKEILRGLGVAGADQFDDIALTEALMDNKIGYAAVLGRQCANDPTLAARMPEAFRRAILSIRGLE